MHHCKYAFSFLRLPEYNFIENFTNEQCVDCCIHSTSFVSHKTHDTCFAIKSTDLCIHPFSDFLQEKAVSRYHYPNDSCN